MLGRYCVKYCTLGVTLEHNAALIGKAVSPMLRSARESDIMKRDVRSSRRIFHENSDEWRVHGDT